MVKKFKKPADPIVRYMQVEAAIFHRAPLSHFLKKMDKDQNSMKVHLGRWALMNPLFPEHAEI
jgi:hypothetical protein